MRKILLIYAAVLFIAGVIGFTFAELKKNTEDEPETYKWMKVLAIMLVILAVICLVASGRSL